MSSIIIEQVVELIQYNYFSKYERDNYIIEVKSALEEMEGD